MYFLPDELKSDQSAIDSLALAIQQAIEDWFKEVEDET